MSGTDRYIILEEIASGSTATVYLAQDTILRRKVALKKLHPHLHNHMEMVRRFAKEAVAIAALSHANIIKVFEYGKEERNLYLAMEYIDGMNLEALLKRGGGSLPNLVALSMFRQLLEGLCAAHARGIYHRDIKPSNVLVDSKGCVRIADFGIAFLSEETSFTRTGSYLGTPGYSAPEQVDGLAVSDKTDIFAMGILFYRCLTGSLPFEGETPHAVLRGIMEKAPSRISAITQRVLPGCQELIESMLAKKPAERPSATDCIERLQGLAGAAGFICEPSRLSAFMEEGETYRERENREVCEAYLAKGRRFQAGGEDREALKAFSLAEAFAKEPGAIRVESDALVKMLRSGSRKRALAGMMAVLALGSAVAFWWPNRLPEEKKADHSENRAIESPAPMTVGKAAGSDTNARAAFVAAKDVLVPSPAKPASPTKRILQAMPSNDFSAKGSMSKSAEKASGDTLVPKGGPNGEASSEVAFVPQAPAPAGYLIVKSSPPFAKLFVDGVEAGTTPTKTPLEMKPGSHELILERNGCRPVHTAFAISPSETTSVRLKLEKIESDQP